MTEIQQYHTKHPTDLAYVFRVDNPGGFPDTVIQDLQRAENDHADKLRVSYWYNEDTDEQSVLIESMSDSALKWLYDWLENTATYYRTEYVDAQSEYRAAKDLADAVYEVMSND